MADYHILTATDDGRALSVAIHTIVPDENNAVGVNLRQALLGSGVSTSSVSFIGDVEKASLAAGQLYETAITFRTRPTETLEQKRDRLDIEARTEQARVQTMLRQRFWAWGYSRAIP